MSEAGLRVIKVGGSLLDAPDLPDRLCDWLDELSPAHSVLIAGGGSLVEELRRLDKLRSLGEAAAHWAAISLMDVAAWILATWIQEFEIVGDYAGLQDRLYDSEDPIVLAPGRFLREVEPKLMGTKLAKSWEVTSDSIAVRLGIILVAEEIVLLKAAPPQISPSTPLKSPLQLTSANLEQLAISGYVDTYLPRLFGEAPPIRIAWLPPE